MYKEKDQLLAGFPESFAADGYTSERLRVPVLWWTLQATQRAPSPAGLPVWPASAGVSVLAMAEPMRQSAD